MRVGFDIDGVLYNFGDSVKRFLDKKGMGDLWKSGPTEAPYWEWYKDWGWTVAEFVEFCNEGADAGIIFTGPPRANAVKSVWDVVDQGHQIIAITDRFFGKTPQVSHNNTYRFFAENMFPIFNEIHFTADKTSVPVDVMVEDKLENYDALVAAGTPTYLINRPWNFVKGGDTRNRIDDVSDYVDAVKTISTQGYVDLSIA